MRFRGNRFSNHRRHHSYYNYNMLLRQEVIEHFKKNNAFNESSAIKMSASDWGTLGINPELNSDIFSFIVKTSLDKYYLDENLLEQKMKLEADNYKKFSKIMFIILGVFLVLWVCGFMSIIIPVFGLMGGTLLGILGAIFAQ